jgi:hypothetical protein
MNEMRKKSIDDLPRPLSFQPYDLLKTICRDTAASTGCCAKRWLGCRQPRS